MELEYVAGADCLELKSLKLYYQSFRNQGIFYEAVTNRILDELVAACSPVRMTLTARWHARGGISSDIVATYEAPSA